MAKELSKSKRVASKTLYEAFVILKDAGGQMRGFDVIEAIRKKVSFDEWETHRYGKTGNTRWESILHFFSIDAVKASFLQKNKGIWILTQEGEAAMKAGAVGLLEAAVKAYRTWKRSRPNNNIEISDEISSSDDELVIETIIEHNQKAILEQHEEVAYKGIKDFIEGKTPYEFQDLVAALLKAMGYYIPFIAAKGRDGGVDIIAYKDPLGVETPRLKVQVKHYPTNPISPDDVRSLKGILHSENEVGIFVTSGMFSKEATRFAREANIHIKLIDGSEFIELWQSNYDKMDDESKNLLPLQPIYFLGSNE
jgi:restriction system protein